MLYNTTSVDNDDDSVCAHVSFNTAKADKCSVVSFDNVSVEVREQCEFEVVFSSELSVGPRRVDADAENGCVGAVEFSEVVLECTHFFIANACKSTWVKGENHGLPAVVSKANVTLFCVFQGKGWGSVSNIDHSDSTERRRISVTQFKQGRNDQRS